MDQAAPVRIVDLAAPEFPDFVVDLMAMAADAPVGLSVDAVYEAAQQQADGMAIYEDKGILERLGVICQSMNEDVDLSALGRATNFGFLVRYLLQRSRMEDLYIRHPQINDVQIDRPIIIAGLPRSGTTHMLNLISVDPRLRSLPYWESLEPIPGRDEQSLAPGQEDPRIQRCRDQLAIQDQIMPYFKNMHEMYPEHTHEEIELQGMDFSMMLFENFALVPRWRDYYLEHDQVDHYRFLKRALKALQWLRGPQRWILKSPQHMEQLAALNRVFPDATFVVPHRDPVSIVASLATMLSYAARMSRNPVVPAQIGSYWADRIERMLHACVRDRDQLPAERSIDVLFDDFMADDVATIERIYQLADHPMSDEVRVRMAQYMQHNPRGKYGRVAYDLKQDFGLDRDTLRQRFGFYYDKFPVRLEG
jgi:hypothetical protein